MKAPPWQPSAEQRAWAAELGGDPELAFVVADDAVRFVRGEQPVFALVDAIGHLHPGSAHALLRGRILTTAAPDPADRAIVQVCGRKFAAGVTPAIGAVPSLARLDLGPASRASREVHRRASAVDAPPSVAGWSDDALVDLLLGLAPIDARSPERLRDRPVSALLVGPDGEVLEAARNTNGTNRVRHAEVNLIERWSAGGARIPVGASVLVGTQCCRMCAALLVRASEDPTGLDVRFALPETGRFGTHTALQALGVERALR